MPRIGDEITPTIQLVRELGAGGMGSVWIADHRALQTQVVVKFMHAQLVADKESMLRFSREAAAGANVKSPHVVQVLDHGLAPDGAPFIVMELLDGHDVAVHLEKNGPMPLADIEAVVTQTCKALARAHERGIVHRDIKPQNIFLTNAGGGEVFVKVLDFGIAKASDLTASAASTTKTGAMMGTPYYMSPEQVIGSKSTDHRTDLWALGVVAYECATGRKPFDAETIGGLAVAICGAPLPFPSQINPTLPVEFDQWFSRACARDLPQRFGSAKEMADALHLLVTGLTATNSRFGMSGAGAYPAAGFPSSMGSSGAIPQGSQVPYGGTPQPGMIPQGSQAGSLPYGAGTPSGARLPSQPAIGSATPQGYMPTGNTAVSAQGVGQPLAEPTAPFGVTTAPVTGGELEPAGVPKRGAKGVMLGVAAVFVLIVVGVGVKLATRSTSVEVATAAQPTESAAVPSATAPPEPPPASATATASTAPPPPATVAPPPPPSQHGTHPSSGGTKPPKTYVAPPVTPTVRPPPARSSKDRDSIE